jgi:hypothetical protein
MSTTEKQDGKLTIRGVREPKPGSSRFLIVSSNVPRNFSPFAALALHQLLSTLSAYKKNLA